RTGTADEHVIATVDVVLELLAVVGHEQVGVRTTLQPVIALVAERVVPSGATEEDVVTGAHEARSTVRVVLALHAEVVSGATKLEVDTGTTIHGVVAVTALDVVVAEHVGEDVVAR